MSRRVQVGWFCEHGYGDQTHVTDHKAGRTGRFVEPSTIKAISFLDRDDPKLKPPCPNVQPVYIFVDASDPRVIPSRTTDPATSHAAARTITVKAGTQRAKLLKAFMLFDVFGGTDEQAMIACQSYGVSPSSEYSKRCSELREAGLIEPTGETRTGASGHQRIVSRITEAGRKVVQSL